MLVLLLASAMAGAFLDHADYCLEFNERWPQHAADEVVWEAGRTLELDGVHHRARVPLEPAYIQTLALLHGDSWTPRSTRTVAFEHTWTHLRQRGDTVVIRTFQPQTWAYDAAALTEAHALRFVDDDRAWTTADKNAVFGALAAVSPRVLPIARGLTLSRTRYISETAVATYSTDGHVIRFSDGVRRVCPDGFEVASGRPAPRGTGSMLHEIGHAVGYAVRASYRRRRVQLDVLIDDLRTDLWGADGETGRYGDIQRGWADSATLRATLVAAFEAHRPRVPRDYCQALEDAAPADLASFREHRQRLEATRAEQADEVDRRRAAIGQEVARMEAALRQAEERVRGWLDDDSGAELHDLQAEADRLASVVGALRGSMPPEPDRGPDPVLALLGEIREQAVWEWLNARRCSAPEPAVLVDARARLQAQEAEADALRARRKALIEGTKALRAVADRDAIHAAYAAVPGAIPGPTAYGATDVVESFAESFELFHTDPESLSALLPEVHAWFAAGTHLDLVEAELRELDAIEARLQP